MKGAWKERKREREKGKYSEEEKRYDMEENNMKLLSLEGKEKKNC
jgi:hypothetical protein